ncbi:Mitochondrial dicarboxylate transporter [Yarrowia sp. B02]|nr:Mitochondrial dicarboxylate transporter [Yarrowia sp. B02]
MSLQKQLPLETKSKAEIPLSAVPAAAKIHYPFWYGGFASVVAGVFTHPLDLAKVRLQTAKTRGQGLFGTLVNVVKHEGITGVYSGLSASMLRLSTYSTMRFGMYEYLKESIAPYYYNPHKRDQNPPMYVLLPISVIAGISGGIVGNPADIINIRMQNDQSLPKDQRRNYKHAFDGLWRMYKEEGVRAMFRGLGPNCTRGVLMTSSQMVSYDSFKAVLVNHLGMNPDKKSTHFAASLLAGLMATTVCSPVDVVKTRIMNAHAHHSKDSAFTIFFKALKQEGPLFMFRGWLPSFVRLGPQTILTYIVLEQLKYYKVGMRH